MQTQNIPDGFLIGRQVLVGNGDGFAVANVEFVGALGVGAIAGFLPHHLRIEGLLCLGTEVLALCAHLLHLLLKLLLFWGKNFLWVGWGLLTKSRSGKCEKNAKGHTS